jgi:S-adenosylmethionine hydrolase
MSKILPITLTSDFGYKDEYVGAVKASILRFLPDAKIVDICHGVTPFSVVEGAFILAAAAPYFTKAVHLAVVDPGVGSSRRALILKTAYGHFLAGPDNGILIPASSRLGGIIEAYEIKPDKFLAHQIAPTFHGRDIFAPAAALIAAGVSPFELGEPLDLNVLTDSPWPKKINQESIETIVASIDNYGTVRLPVYFNELRNFWGDPKKIRIVTEKAKFILRRGEFFSQFSKGELFFYEDSSSFLAISANLERADKILGLKIEAEIRLERVEEK